MRLNHHAMALVAGTLAVQAVPCQDTVPVYTPPLGVSMTVFAQDGPVGYACEPFQCGPNNMTAVAGEMLGIEVYGGRGTFYALLGGMPTPACQPIAGIGGGLVLGSPAFTLGFGGISDFAAVADCDVGMAFTNFTVPDIANLDIAVRLQAVAFTAVGPGMAFSRGVEIRVR